ncbi:hypothetical protein GUITHDRAFT_49502, partial [Guillardia theta CCMP2712]
VMASAAIVVLLAPHGLNAIFSALLASSIRQSRKERILIRSMKSLEVMGSITSICIDKNGLLTSGPKTLV